MRPASAGGCAGIFCCAPVPVRIDTPTMGYTKLFSDLVASSVWDEDDKTRIVWITMLALKDRDHFVRGTVRFIALASRIPESDCLRAIDILSEPDPRSRTPDNDGRRIQAEPGGWLVLNGRKYNEMLSHAERREYNARKQAEYRKRKKHARRAAERDGAQQALNEGMRESGAAKAANPSPSSEATPESNTESPPPTDAFPDVPRDVPLQDDPSMPAAEERCAALDG